MQALFPLKYTKLLNPGRKLQFNKVYRSKTYTKITCILYILGGKSAYLGTPSTWQ